MATCPNCGRKVSDNLMFCGNCGAPIDNGQVPSANPAPYSPPQGYAAPAYNAAAKGGGSPAKSIVGMIFSIVGLSLAIVGTGLFADLMSSASNLSKLIRLSDEEIVATVVMLSFGFGFALPGLIVSCTGRRNRRGRKMGTAGMIMGIIGIVLSIAMLSAFGYISSINS